MHCTSQKPREMKRTGGPTCIRFYDVNNDKMNDVTKYLTKYFKTFISFARRFFILGDMGT